MATMKMTGCMKIVSKMSEADQDALLARLDAYQADGVPAERAQVMAARDTLAEIQGERAQLFDLLRDQHPDLFTVSADEVVSTDPSAADEAISFSRRRGPAPKKTVTAYKLFRVDERQPGQLFPLFVNANESVPLGQWQDADIGPAAQGGKVKSKLGPLAFRPGWHAGDLPIATHIGGKSSPDLKKPDMRPANQVWAEVELAADRDWQTEANKRGTNAQGKLIPVKAHITDQVPKNGFYRYKTNPNMTGNWLISGSMKVNRVLTDAEVARINKKAGVADLPREEPFDSQKYGFDAKLSRTRAQTDTPEFKRWFGDSKVVDAEGKPLVMYHGAKQDIEDGVFRMEKGMLGTGAYFTSNPQEADFYTSNAAWRTDANIVPAYVSIKNPYYTTSKWDKEALKAKENGHDGVILIAPDGSIDWAIPFTSTQIKSAIGNNGDFDPKNPNINASRQRGINVRNDGDNRYADLIVDGEKTMESRDSDSLRPYVGQTVGIIRTGEGPAKLIGSVKIGEPVQVDEQEFRNLESEHLVPEGSAFDIKPGATKFLYPLTDAQRFDEERSVDSRGIVAREVQFSRQRQTDTPAFKRWFGDSQVVDENGEPLRVYHGMPSEMEGGEFRASKYGTLGEGIYFTSNPEAAGKFADGSRGYREPQIQGNIVPVYLKMEQPFDDEFFVGNKDWQDWAAAFLRDGQKPDTPRWEALSSFGRSPPDREALLALHDKLMKGEATIADLMFAPNSGETYWGREIVKAIKDHGAFDGLILKNSPKGFDEYVVFEPTQIKSAIGNTGSFDPTNPDITASRPRLIEDIPNEDWLQGKVDYAEKKGRNAYGVPHMSTITGYFDKPVEVSLRVLSKLPGERNEQNNVREKSLEYIRKHWDEVSKQPPYIEVAHNGEAWVSEGNHRIMVAAEKGIESMPVEIRYFDGGQRSSGPLRPSRIPSLEDTAIDASRQRIVGESKRQYTPEQLAMFENTGRTVTVPTLKERIKELRKNLGATLAQGLADPFTSLKALDSQAYLMARLSKGSTGAFEAMLKYGKLSMRDGAYDADQSGGFIERVGVPLQGEVEDFLWWVAANRAERLAAEDRENLFTPADIAAGKSLDQGTADYDYTLQHNTNGKPAGTVTRDRTLIYRDALKTFDEFNRNAMDMAERSGLIDPASRKLWENEFYVPFYRVAQDNGVMGAQIKDGLVRQQAFKRLKGGTDKLHSDLLANTLSNWAHLLDAGAKNRAGLAALEAAKNLGVAIEADEKTVRDMAKSLGRRNDVVWVMDQGRERYFFVEDKLVLASLNAIQFTGMNDGFTKALGTFKNVLTVGVTASPPYKIRNLVRDTIQAISVSPLSYNPLSNVVEGVRASSRESPYYVSALAGGGLIRFGTMLEGNDAARTRMLIDRGVDKTTILDSEEKLKAFYNKAIKGGWDAYNELGNRGEEITRMSLYKQLVDQGMDHAQASYLARDLQDFSLQGTWPWIRFLSQVVPFFNARVQGMYKLGRGAAENPARFAAVLGAVTLASVALMAAYGDDEDWKKREDWDRNNYWWFKVGGVAWRIPKPFEVGALATLAERTLEYFVSPEMTGQRLRQNVLSILKDNLSMNPVPQVAKPILDVYANKNSYTGRPIETMGMERLQPQYRYTQSTSMVARGLSAVAGGTLSPVQVDSLLRGYFGTMGAYALAAADALVRPMTNEPTRPTADYIKTVSLGFAGSVDQAASRYVSQVYEQAKELEQVMGTYRMLVQQGRTQEAEAFKGENIEKLSRYRSVEAVKRGEARYNEVIQMVSRSNLSPDEKRARITELNNQKDQLARRVAPGYAR